MIAVVIDLLLLSGLVLGTVLGYRTGVLKRVFNILVVLAAIGVVAICLPTIGSFFLATFPFSEKTNVIIAMVFLVAATIIPAMGLYHWFDKDVSGNEASRFFGAILGLLEASVVMSMVLVVLNLSQVPDQETRDDSLLYSPVAHIAPWSFDYFAPRLPYGSRLHADLVRIFQDSTVNKPTVDGKEKL